MTESNNRIYYIYKITNNVNGKTYIGKRFCPKNKSLEEDKYMGSGISITSSKKKYGIENFSKEIIAVCYSEDILNILEKQYIALYRSVGKAEYNIADGGEGGHGPMLPETIEKIRLKNLGRIVSDETKKKISEAHKNLSEESRKHISEGQKNRRNPRLTMSEEQLETWARNISNGIRNSEKWYKAMHSEEHSRKLSEAGKGRVSPNKGKRMGEDFCNNVSRAIKALYNSDRGEKIKEKIKAARANQVITEETKKKMSESQKGRIVSEETREKLRVVNTGKIVSEDTKRKIREARAEQVFTPEQEEKRKEGVRRFWDSEEGLKLRKINSERAKGRPSNSKGKHWYHRGTENVLAFECPPGFEPGKYTTYRPSEETKRKHASWIKSLTPEELAAYKAKLSESHKGIVFTEERCRHISEAKKGKPGRKQSEETREKISETLKGRNKNMRSKG